MAGSGKSVLTLSTTVLFGILGTEGKCPEIPPSAESQRWASGGLFPKQTCLLASRCCSLRQQLCRGGGGGKRGDMAEPVNPTAGGIGSPLVLVPLPNRFVPTLYCFLQRRGMFSKGSDLVYWCLAGEHVAVSQPGSKVIPWLETKAGEKPPRTAPADAVAAAVVGDAARRSVRTGCRSSGACCSRGVNERTRCSFTAGLSRKEGGWHSLGVSHVRRKSAPELGLASSMSPLSPRGWLWQGRLPTPFPLNLRHSSGVGPKETTVKRLVPSGLSLQKHHVWLVINHCVLQ